MRTLILLTMAGMATLSGSGSVHGQQKAPDTDPRKPREIPIDRVTTGGKTLAQWVAVTMQARAASWELRKALAYALGTTGMDPDLLIPKKAEPKGDKAEEDQKPDKSSTEAKEGPNPIAVKALTSALRTDNCAQVRL